MRPAKAGAGESAAAETMLPKCSGAAAGVEPADNNNDELDIEFDAATGDLVKSPRITVAPRRGSFEQRASFRLMRVGPQTPREKRKLAKKTNAPSSRSTVVTVAGLFVVGMMLILSGLIVLLTDNNKAHGLRVTGWVFFSVGLVSLVICGIVQRKNWVRYLDETDEALYFLHLGKNPVWKLMRLDMLDWSAALGYSAAQPRMRSNRDSSNTLRPDSVSVNMNYL